ncbi:MAG: hypothetical protein Fur0046_31960 [Cyanobacteria bacterium J069]|nr:MAG: hypothetical protein D6742_05175 [Cyanobacteria bacterium J069]
MFASVLPLRAIAFQILFLLMAIAIESHVFAVQLALPPKQPNGVSPQQSVQIAATLNLLTAMAGWFVFFLIQPWLPLPLKQQLLSFIFFDQWSADAAFPAILAGFLTFFASFAVKLLGLAALEWLLLTPDEWASRRESSNPRYRLGQGLLKDKDRDKKPPTNLSNTLLAANAFSYTAILAVLFARRIVDEVILTLG